jgi:uncharacterized protein YecE (DUF72 family)
MRVKVGTCGWSVKGGQPTYFSIFGIIELQDTFYNLPRLERVKRLREKAPQGFEFVVKAWQAVTHPITSPTWRRGKPPPGQPQNIGMLKPTEENFMAWKAITEVCRALSSKVCVVQTPPKFNCTEENARNMRKFLSSVERSTAVGWEPRGPWDAPLVKRLCEDLDLIHIVDPFRREPSRLSSVVYFRLHGIGKGEVNYSYKYSNEDLGRLLMFVRKFEGSVEEAYVMFNNLSMAEDALKFKNMLENEP